ncbi:sulfotransferase family protein [Actinomadura macrotermitis]|uniref:Sulfotransferase family protein n=1 Tax=Actinomadura macrotermitis TaxID=2585200 RepID=A0A7K0C1X9_9ACTN|nr:hypothetical protein [Actinomadura macrotermitis]
MKIIGAGYGRTGTLSLKAAIERLGFGPCHHMTEAVRKEQLGGWLAKTKGRPVPWDRLLGGYESCVDWPAAAYWRELTEHYPAAKVVLSVRDPGRWAASMRATILAHHRRGRTLPGRALTGLSALLGTDLARFIEMTSNMPEVPGFADLSDEELAKAFERHTEEVRAGVDPSRLLVFEVAQGWEPLCAFLGVPVPDEPFPRVNDTAQFQEQAKAMMRQLMLRR